MKVKPVVPTLMVREASEIPFGMLWGHGYRGILWDLERTLIPLGCRSMTDYAVQVVEQAREAGFTQTCCTNSTYPYGNDLLRHFGHRIAQPDPDNGLMKKPDPSIFQRGCSLLMMEPEQVVMVGDKLLFDTSPAAALGMGTVLVNPLPGYDVWAEYLAFRRTKEKLALRHLGLKRP
ncbi:MAG: putative phosphatase [Patescibacteria group bacterium]|nr:putative phosphatase [Patescibacteria group bacterium]